MKAIKNYMSCLAIIILTLISEPIRFFCFLSSLVIFVMIGIDGWKEYKKWKR